MGLNSDLYDALHNDATVEGLVGTRITPYIQRQKATMPYIYWESISLIPIQTLSGDTGVVMVNRQLVCVASTSDEADTLAKAVRDVFADFYHSGNFEHIRVTNETDMANLDEVNELIERYAKIVEVEIMYREDSGT